MGPGERARGAFARLLLDAAPEHEPTLIGVEHEFALLKGTRPVDFRGMVDGLGLDPPHLNPADAYGYRLSSGSWLTCDESEAEVAIAPVPVVPGFAGAAVAAARCARAELVRLLPPGHRLDGVSTHLSVSAPAEDGWSVADLLVRSFAPALMLLTDRDISPGLIVRPRPTRTEVCGEFVEGRRLGAATAMAAGAALACARRLAGDGGAFPAELRVRLRDTWQRYGWYADREGFGPDLYREGREGVLTTVSGASLTAQRHLEICWDVARSALGDRAGSEDVSVVDALVSGDIPLPLEDAEWEADDEAVRRWLQEPLTASGFGELTAPRARPGFSVDAVLTTWDVAVFLLVGDDGVDDAFGCVPRRCLATFYDLLDKGCLDEVTQVYLASPRTGRMLESVEQTMRPGLFDHVWSRQALLPAELMPAGRRSA